MAWFTARRGGRAGPKPARSLAEIDMYLSLYACTCGDRTTPPPTSGATLRDGTATVTYSDRCPTCGAERSFTFRQPPFTVQDSTFGEGTSELLDPGEWLAAAARAADGSNRPDVSTKKAIAAIEEAFRFIPPGQKSVPRKALRSTHSRTRLAADPRAFDFDVMLALFRSGFGGRPAAPTSRRAVRHLPDPVRIQVPGRCPSGSFSPDGTELAVASGFQRTNNLPHGEIAVFDLPRGRCLQRHEFEAYHAQVLHTGREVLVADWQLQAGSLVPGDLARYRPGGREVLMSDVGINPMVHTSSGFAALTHQGDLLLGAADDVRALPPPGPVVCLAVDLGTGRIAVGGDRLVLLDGAGQRLATALVPTTLLDVVFVGPDRLVGVGPGFVTLWRTDGHELTVAARTDAVPRLDKLAAPAGRQLVVGIDREQYVTIIEVTGDALHVVATPAQLHGRTVWGSPGGRLLALPDRINEHLPPAPEQIEVHDTQRW